MAKALACLQAGVYASRVRRGDSPLRRELDDRGITNSWLAKRLGVTPWKFSRIEAGVTRVPDGYYERAAELLNVDLDKVVPDKETAPAER